MLLTNRHYRVQAGDTIVSITIQFTGDAGRYLELIMANPLVPSTVINGRITFMYPLVVGQVLNLPPNWVQPVQIQVPRVVQFDNRGNGSKRGFNVVAPRFSPPMGPRRGMHGIDQGVGRLVTFGLGDPMSDGTAAALVAAFNADQGVTVCTSMPIINGVRQPNPAVLAFQVSYNATTTGQKLDQDGLYGPNCATALANTLAAAGSTLQAPGDCSNFTAPSPLEYTATDLQAIAAEVAGDFTLCNGYNTNVAAFQDAYNAAVPGSTLGITQDYGFYTAATAAAMASSSVTLTTPLTPPAACTNWPNPAGPGKGGTTPPPIQPPFQPPTQTTPPTNTGGTTTATNWTPWIIGLLAVVAGAGALYYVNRHKHTASSSPTLGPSSHPASTSSAKRMLARGGHHVKRAGRSIAHHARSAGRRAKAVVHHATRR